MTKVEVVFKKFVSIYGAQKVAAMWAGADIDDVKADWSRQLDRVSGPAIGAGLLKLVDSGSEWPPSMGAFMALCKEPKDPAHAMIKLALPAPEVPPEVIAANLSKVKELATVGAKDPLFWAKRPASGRAVQLLAMGAQQSQRLRDILAAHYADGGMQCRSEGAVKALLAMAP